MQNSTLPPSLPSNLGRYVPKRILAQTNSATVYLADDPKLVHREVVLKVMSLAISRDDVWSDRFSKEASFLGELEHPAIVPLYDFGIEKDQPFLVMRYMRGGTLSDRLSSGRLSPSSTCDMVDQISDALEFAHHKGIIHRDIKPLNILYDDHGNAYLSDFGIAAFLDKQGKITGPGTIGTAVFMSPEQALGQTLTEASDIYSLGIVVFFCLTGRPPFDYSKDASPMAIMNQHVHVQPMRLRQVEPGLSVSLENVVAQALEKSPIKRFASARGFAAALRTALVNSENLQSPPIPRGDPPIFPTDKLSDDNPEAIWVCKFCGFSFQGSNQACPICGNKDFSKSSW